MIVYRIIKKLTAIYPRKILPTIVSFLLSVSIMLFFVRFILERTVSFEFYNVTKMIVLGMGIVVSGLIADIIYQNYRWHIQRLIKNEADPHGVLDLVVHSSWPRLLQIVLVKNLIILLFTTLLIIPGIIAGYALALAPQYYLDNNEMTIREACVKSFKSMKERAFLYMQIQFMYSWSYIIPLGLFVLFYLNNQENVQVAIEMGQDFIDLVFGMLTGVFALVILIFFALAVFLEPKKAYMKQLLYILTTDEGKELEKKLEDQDE